MSLEIEAQALLAALAAGERSRAQELLEHIAERDPAEALEALAQVADCLRARSVN
jgi:hypothetical protein